MSDYIGGRNAVLEALKSERPPQKVFFSYGTTGENIDAIWAEASRRKVPCSTMDRRKFVALEQKADLAGRSQGVLALAATFPTLTVSQLIEQAYSTTDAPLIVLLDGITDPHNMGAIIRSAEGAGANGMVIAEKNSAPLTPTVMKVSAGALQHVPIAKSSTVKQALEDLRNADFTIIGTADEGSVPYTEDLYREALVLVIGAEGLGLSAEARGYCTSFVSIPMNGKVSSLNASVATGIVLFEAIRQRRTL